MMYIGEFRDINEVLYKVEIETPTEGEDETLVMSGEPVIISYESEDEQAYKPYKCSTATISFYLNEANFDLIDAFANRVKVTIYKENQVIWCGFATPNAYSQSYEDYKDEFELECQDGISTLQYYDYEYIPTYSDYGTMDEEHPYNNQYWDKALTEHNKATNFFHLIMMMNKKLGGIYENIYVTDSIINPYTRDISILDSTFISENNFFDEDGKPMKMLEILEEICRYCSLTCVPYGKDLYFVNYDAIAQDINTYFAYERIQDEEYNYKGKVTLQSNLNIDINTFSSKGCKMNIDSVYNYNEVKDDLYSVDSIMPSLEENRVRTEATDIVDSSKIADTENIITWVEDDTFSSNYGEVHIKNERNDKKNWVFLRYYGYDWTKYKDKRVIFYYYNKDTANYDVHDENPINFYDSNYTNSKHFNWLTTYNLNGACIVDYAVVPVDNWNDIVRSQDFETAILFHTTDISNSDSIGSEGSQNRAEWLLRPVQPMVKFLIEPHFMKKNDYIVISGEFANYHYWDKLPINEERNDNCIGGILPNNNYWCGVWVELKCGDYYWNGESWQLSKTQFSLPLEFKKEQKAFNNFIPIKNIISYDMKLDEEGYCVPCLPDGYEDLEGELNTIEFTIYRPHSFSTSSKRITLLKDFDIKIVGRNKDNVLNDEDANTTITSVKPSDNVSEYDNVDCKICSWAYKAFNWSQTFYIQYYRWNDSTKQYYNGGVSFIDDSATLGIDGNPSSETLITDLLSNTLLTQDIVFKSLQVIYDVAKGYVLTPEELIISKNVEQYDNPTLNLTCNLKIGDIKPYSKVIYKSQFPDFIFAVDSIEYNLRENEAQVKLINKKIEYEE